MSGGSGAATRGVVETPGVSQFFCCTPLGPAGWAIVLACSATATAGAAVLPRLLPAVAAEATPADVPA